MRLKVNLNKNASDSGGKREVAPQVEVEINWEIIEVVTSFKYFRGCLSED